MKANKLILIVGLPGTGKTTFASALATTIGAKHLNSDIVRSEAGRRGHYDAMSKAANYNEMKNRTEGFLQNNQSVIIDATFYKEIFRKPYQLMGEQFDVEVKWIEIFADQETIKERVSKKRKYSEADYEVYKKIKEDYEPLNVAKLILWSDQLSVEEMVAQTVDFLKL
ncbi:MAG: ATP-binding protein [Bacteroidota bacterium]